MLLALILILNFSSPLSEKETVGVRLQSHTEYKIIARWSFSTQNAPGRRNLSFCLHLPKFVCVKAVYPGDYKIFLNSFVKFVFIIG